MISGVAGGHVFKNGVCDCGVALVNIQWVTDSDVGKPNIAHSGTATANEINQIRELAGKMHKQVDTSFGWRD